MKRRLLFVLLAVALSCVSQTARVIELKPEDAQMVKSACEKLDAAQKAYDDAVDRVRQEYTVVLEGDPDAGATWVADKDESGFLVGSGTTKWVTVGGYLTWRDDDPCTRSLESVACLTNRLRDAKALEAEGKKPKPRIRGHYKRRGWENGFEFTPDFRFIVPKPEPPLAQPGPWNSTAPNNCP